ncbi:FlgO family outer membrane protein [Psychrosphaera sp.]|nr:FlgO family outer membrane protein [Psychrosphaera sp.]
MKKFTAILIATQVAACSSLTDWSVEESYTDNTEVEQVVTDQENQLSGNDVAKSSSSMNEEVSKPRLDNDGVVTVNDASLKFQNDYRNHLLGKMNEMGKQQPNRGGRDKNINFYVRGLMQDLVSNMKYVNSTTPIAVTSFVMLDSDFQYADILGKQISESFIHEVHKFGIPVIDFKTTDFVRVTPDGDFIFSKDYLELEGDLPIKYAVAGTLTKQLSGYLVNARVIGIDSKAVVASAQGFLPNNVVNQLTSSGFNDGIPLVSSERNVD